jgi:hypothetical protein
MNISPAPASALDALVAECHRVLAVLSEHDTTGFASSFRPVDRVRWLADQAEHTTQAVAFMSAMPAPSAPDLAVSCSSIEGRRWFLRNAGFYHDIIEGKPPNLSSLLERWHAQRWAGRRLYLLQGFALDGPLVAVPGGSIRTMTAPDLEVFFKQRSREAFGRPLALEALSDRVFLDVEVPTVTSEYVYFGPDKSQPWVAFLNLYSPTNVAVRSGHMGDSSFRRHR